MFRDLPLPTFRIVKDSRRRKSFRSIACRDGEALNARQSCLESLDRNRVSSILSEKDLPGAQVTSLLEDHQGRLWVGIRTIRRGDIERER